MTAHRLTVCIHGDVPQREMQFETADIRTALAVADINSVHGHADILSGERLIARLAKRGDAQASFWEIY